MHTTIVGNITDDPELRFTPSGLAVANFTLAENRRKFNKQTNEWEDVGTSYYRCAVWREAAENAAESLTRGTRVMVSGDAYQETYTKRDGGEGMAVRVDVDEFGPSLKYATAKVSKTPRRDNGGGQQGGGNRQGGQSQQGSGWGGQTADSDPWGAPSSGNDEPPF